MDSGVNFWKEITSPIGSGGSQINAFAVFYFAIESCGNPQNIHKWKGVETTENSPCVSWFNGSLSKANSQRRESYHLLSRWTRELVLWRNIFSISSGGHGGSGWFCSFLRSSLVKNYIPVIKCLAIEFFSRFSRIWLATVGIWVMKWIHIYSNIYIYIHLEPQMTFIFGGQPNPPKNKASTPTKTRGPIWVSRYLHLGFSCLEFGRGCSRSFEQRSLRYVDATLRISFEIGKPLGRNRKNRDDFRLSSKLTLRI